MGLLADSAALLEDPTASTQIPAPVQASREVDRLRILQDERAREMLAPDTRDRFLNLQALDKEIGKMTGTARPKAASSSTLLGSAISALDDGGAAPAASEPPPTPTAATAVPGHELREPATVQLAKTGLNQLTGLGSSIVGGWNGLLTIAKGGTLEDATRSVQSPHIGNFDLGTYEGGSTMEKAAAAPGQALAAGGSYVGGKVADVTGSPAAGAAVDTAIQGAPSLLLLKGRAPVAAPKLVGSSSVAEIAKPAIAAPVENLDIPTVIRRRAAAEAQAAAANDANAAPTAAPAPAPVAAPPKATPADATPPQAAAAAAEEAAPKFIEEPPAAKPGVGVPPAEQARRAAVLQSVGVTEARQSALTGDPKAAATDFQQAKVQNSAGDRMRAGFDAERQALTNHAEDIVRDTGGSVGTDAAALEARGATILSPLEAFKDWFTAQTKGLYNEARAKAQTQAVSLDRFNNLLGVDSKFQNSDTLALRNGIRARMKELGMIDADAPPSQVLLASVDQAEALRQYVNEEWSPRANGRIRELKNALDDDVTRAAGDDTFAKARQLHAMKMAIFEDPKGLSAILDSEGPNGINRKVPVEKVADTITALPNAQFAHIIETLKRVPPELQPQAQAALAEIKGHMANRVLEAGAKRETQWGARDVSTLLNKYAAKLPLVFSPEELAKFQNLNEAGHILRVDTSYPGAAVQGHNLIQRGALGAVRSGLAAAGAFVAGPLGAAVADAGGAALTGKMTEAAALRGANKRFVKLSDFPK